MEFRGTYHGRPVSGILLRDRVVATLPAVEAEILYAVARAEPVYIAGLVDEYAALDEGPAGYATVACVLDSGTASFEPALEVEEIPDDAVA